MLRVRYCTIRITRSLSLCLTAPAPEPVEELEPEGNSRVAIAPFSFYLVKRFIVWLIVNFAL